MKRIYTVLAVAAIAAISAAACSDDDGGSNGQSKFNPGTISLTQEQTAMSAGQNNFAWRMLGEVNKAAAGGNTIISPLSMTYCLGMVNAGAAGTTSAEISNTLGFSGGSSDVNQYCAKLLKEMPKLDKKTTLNIANCVEVNKPYTLLTDYEKTVKESYNALVENRDFGGSGFKKHVNDWVSKQTNGMIPQLIDQLKTDAVAYIINAVYFKGQWAEKFNKHSTAKAPFYKYGGSIAEVSMMYQQEDFKYASDDNFEAVSLNYGNGSYSMQIVLPNEGTTVSDVIAAMQTRDWKDFVSSMTTYKVKLYVPKFTIEYGGNMNDVLKQLGVKSMFEPSADFSKFCNAGVYISEVVQKARIEVDEEGTTAAAATHATGLLTDIGPGNIVTFRADRPFIYVITEHSTGTICFIGVFSGE